MVIRPLEESIMVKAKGDIMMRSLGGVIMMRSTGR